MVLYIEMALVFALEDSLERCAMCGQVSAATR